jgi:hypothetical protein
LDGFADNGALSDCEVVLHSLSTLSRIVGRWKRSYLFVTLVAVSSRRDRCPTSRRNDMPVFARTLCAATLAVAVATSAFAQQGDPWTLQERKPYVADMQGNMNMMQPKERGKRAKPVPKGMVFFKNNSQLYMMEGNRSLFETNF